MLFVHGLEGGPLGRKPAALRADLRIESVRVMGTRPWWRCMWDVQEALHATRPDVVVASSLGAWFVACVLRAGIWAGPTLLVSAPPLVGLPPGSAHRLHGAEDALFPLALVSDSTIPPTVVPGDGHQIRSERGLRELCDLTVLLGAREPEAVATPRRRGKGACLAITLWFALVDGVHFLFVRGLP